MLSAIYKAFVVKSSQQQSWWLFGGGGVLYVPRALLPFKIRRLGKVKNRKVKRRVSFLYVFDSDGNGNAM